MSLTDLFIQNLQRVGGNTHVVGNIEEARAVLHRLHSAEGGGPIVCWNTPLAESLDCRATAISQAMPMERRRELCLAAAMGITESDGALADSGTLVLESGPARSRMVSLLPLVHVAILQESLILESFAQFVMQFVNEGGPGRLKALSALTFITGPSRTADIEQTLTIGVHGPQSLHVMILCGH